MAEGVETVLVNSNPATIMTDAGMADSVYIEPLCARTVERIIEAERPDSLLAGLGGQTGLNIAMELHRSGFLERRGVRLIGTNIDAILKCEDRQLFKDAMEAIGQPTVPSRTAETVTAALAAARAIGYPVIVRPAFTLGGSGGGVAYTEAELQSVAAAGIEASPIGQILVEKYIFGWKEIEFEVMRDAAGSAVTVCSMRTWTPWAYTRGQHRRGPGADAGRPGVSDAAHGGAGHHLRHGHRRRLQLPVRPRPAELRLRRDRGQPARLALLGPGQQGHGLPDSQGERQGRAGLYARRDKNEVTGETFACFEPALDYVVVKLPRWPFDKFAGASRTLGPQMKATGEVMAIAPTFEAALMKAVRGAEIKLDTLDRPYTGRRPLAKRLRDMDDERLFTLFEALKAGYGVEELHGITRIDRWFLEKLRGMAELEAELAGGLTAENVARARAFGYTAAAISRISGEDCPAQAPCYKMVDTCAAEFDARTPYFYSVPAGQHCDARERVTHERESVLVLGSGPIRIGQGIEFDYSSVHCVRTLRALGYDVAIVNNNPETVSTDYDTASRLYFEPLCPEDVMGVIAVERPVGVVVAFGGQTAISLANFLVSQGVKILGTSAEGIDLAEDREKFDALLGSLGMERPRAAAAHTVDEALAAAEELGCPVLLRPSYVIGGQNMVIAHDREDVRRYMALVRAGGNSEPVLIDKYMPGTELEVDVISDGGRVLIPGIMEHIERAGVHSGDSIAVYPPMDLGAEMTERICSSSRRLALALGTRGLVNIQYLIYEGRLCVIEVNPRASRTVPYLSKVTGVPMVDIATRVMMGATLESLGWPDGLWDAPPLCAVKAPVFSFGKVADANSLLGPEMKSTGEVLGVGAALPEALFKALCAAGYDFVAPGGTKRRGVLLSVENRQFGELAPLVRRLDAEGLRLFATPDTAAAVRALGCYAFDIGPALNAASLGELLERAEIGLVVYTGALHDDTMADFAELQSQALRRGIPCLTSLDTALAAAEVMSEHLSLDSVPLWKI